MPARSKILVMVTKVQTGRCEHVTVQGADSGTVSFGSGRLRPDHHRGDGQVADPRACSRTDSSSTSCGTAPRTPWA